jgi:PAS domain-containing protein
MSSNEYAEQEAGIYSWNLDTDTAYGDTAVAALFGLDPTKTIIGLPISEYLKRIYPEDQTEVARLVSEAVTSGEPYRAEYRVMDADNTIRTVMAFGRCFRTPAGNPTLYAGIVHPLDEPA